MEKFLEFINIPSITGSPSEKEGGFFLEKELRNMDYFKVNSENIKRTKVLSDGLDTYVISGFYRGKTNKTIILMGHYDVVDISNYGKYKKHAFSPNKLKKDFLKDNTLGEDAKKDLESNNWIWGRGTADMKMGLYTMLKVLRKCIEDKVSYSILYLAVPSEESTSAGMRCAGSIIKELLYKGYSFIGTLLSEPCLQNKNELVKKIHIGSCGKCMPIIMACGKSAHIFESSKGHNSNTMLSFIQREIEESGLFFEEIRGKKINTITQLFWEQIRESYSVTVPEKSYSYYNLIFLNKTYKEINENIEKCVYKAKEKYEKFKGINLNIYSFLELEENLKESSVIKKVEILNDLKNSQKSLQEKSIEYFEWIIDESDILKPCFIYGFMPPYYPATHCNKNNTKKIENIVKDINKEFLVDLKIEHYFMGISDLSFIGGSFNDNKMFLDNLIGGENLYSFDNKTVTNLEMPSLVLGVLGKDIHQKTERVEIDYNINKLPKIYRLFMDKLYKENIEKDKK